MSESLHEMAVRMSGGRCSKGCDYCPAHVVTTYPLSDGCLIRRLAMIENADKQIEALKKWTEMHPKKTWLDVFNERFSFAARKWPDKTPHMCPSMLFGSAATNEECADGCYAGTCHDCWNREVTEE